MWKISINGNLIINITETIVTWWVSNFSYCHNIFKLCLLQRHQKASICEKGLKYLIFFEKYDFLNPFPHVDNFWHLCSRQLLKLCDKRRNCSKQAIPPFATKFSTFFSICTYNKRAFPYFLVDIFKVVCCRFVICGKI